MNNDLPPDVKSFFWGDSLSELNWKDHQKYIVQTLLSKGDEKAIHWLFSQINHQEVKAMLPSLRLDSKSATFWDLYLQ